MRVFLSANWRPKRASCRRTDWSGCAAVGAQGQPSTSFWAGSRRGDRACAQAGEGHREEARAVMPDWAARVEDHDIGTAARYVQSLAHRTGLELTSYRSLRDLQRAG